MMMGHASSADHGSSSMGRIEDTLHRLYDSLLEPDSLRTGMDAVRHLFGVDHLALISRSADSPTHITSNLILDDTPRAAFEADYVNAFCAKDPFVNLPFDRPLIVQDLIGEDAWQANDFFQHFLQPMNVFYVMGADILVRPGTIYSIRLCRRRDAPRFSDDDVALFRKVLPHLRRFGQLNEPLVRMRMLEQVLDTLTGSMKLGTVILDGNARVVHSAGLAEIRLSRREGFYLSSGRLRASTATNDQKLQNMLRQVGASAEGTPRDTPQAARFEDERGALGVALRRLPDREQTGRQGQAITLITFRDLDSETEVSEDSLKRLFGLTVAEARLARLLVLGRSIDESAEKLGVSRNTLRTHLRALFQKTGTARQAELVRTLISASAVFC